MNRNFLLAGIIFLFFISCKTQTITLESLLQEMTEKTNVTYFPKNKFTVKQCSSYDRKSVSPDDKNWWANADYTQFVREEENNGRREFVLLETDGPGAIVRWWMTFAGEGASNGIIRIYLDENTQPEIEGNVLDVLSGNFLTTEPLASSVSPETEYQRRGHNLYLPIPYAKKCKITYECEVVKFVDNRWRPSSYYNINYRTYEPGVKVESFSVEKLKMLKEQVDKTNSVLLNETNEGEPVSVLEQRLQADEKMEIPIEIKGKAISKISVKIDAENLNQALRSTVISLAFDGNETVWVPLGDFFGTGFQIHSSKTWYSKVSENGNLESTWIMPFKNKAQLTLTNFGEQAVNAEIEVFTCDYKWKKQSMYFGASWHELHQIHTASDPKLENHEWHYDVNYVDVKGKGLYVGDALTVFNTVDAWWGEGDEKIFVDGEEFPSCIGTGTEDYYGYAWCRPEKFTHPFIAQPSGAGNFHPGMTVNLRYRSLDVLPFTSNISSNIEMWHWVKTKINYAMTAFWYALPGFESNVKPVIEMVKKPVALKRTDIYPPIVDENGKIEGEYLEVFIRNSGTVSTQSGDFGWSNDNQLWWRNGETGSELVAKFILNESGKYKISAQLTKAIDYGIIQLLLNGKEVGRNFNGYNSEVVPVNVELGTHLLNEGEQILSVKLLGADKNAKPGNMVGIDYLQFEKQ